MPNDIKWMIISSGRYMFLRFASEDSTRTDEDNFGWFSTGFLAKIHYGNDILNQNLVVIMRQSLHVTIHMQ